MRNHLIIQKIKFLPQINNLTRIEISFNISNTQFFHFSLFKKNFLSQRSINVR